MRKYWGLLGGRYSGGSCGHGIWFTRRSASTIDATAKKLASSIVNCDFDWIMILPFLRRGLSFKTPTTCFRCWASAGLIDVGAKFDVAQSEDSSGEPPLRLGRFENPGQRFPYPPDPEDQGRRFGCRQRVAGTGNVGKLSILATHGALCSLFSVRCWSA